MKKMIVSSLLAVLLVPGTQVFAQFKSPMKAAKNWDNLRRIVVNAVHNPKAPRIISWVPARFVKGEKIGISVVQVPQKITPVTRSMLIKAGKSADAKHMQLLANQFLLGTPGEHGYGKAFYEDQTELARDLNEFYEGKADVRIGPGGRQVKLYALPVDGILYKPVGYNVPVVLNSDEYFVIYNTQTGTGQIAENKPEVYNLFKPRLEDEIWQAMGKDKVFDDLNNLCDAIMLAHLHKARLVSLGKEVDIRTAVTASQAEVYKQLNASEELFNYLQQLPAVRETSHGFKAYVVELPVDGLTWVEADGTTHVYNTQDHVMLFFELGSVGIFPRADVANPENFTPVKK